MVDALGTVEHFHSCFFRDARIHIRDSLANTAKDTGKPRLGFLRCINRGPALCIAALRAPVKQRSSGRESNHREKIANGVLGVRKVPSMPQSILVLLLILSN